MIEINDKKSIGRVLFIVEGSKTEFAILRKIFCDILKYEYIEKRRNRPDTFKSKNNSTSKVAVINTEESNINYITDSEEYLGVLFEMLRKKYDFPVDNAAIYYLFDRDPKSNTDVERIKTYIDTLKDPYDNGITKAGMFLLSYPSIEAYTVSGFEKNSCEMRKNLGSELKTYIGENKNIQFNKFSESIVLNAADEFLKYLFNEKLNYDLDDFSPTSKEIFSRQEKEYLSGNGYKLFSMLTLAFMQLGIITYTEAIT